MINDESLEVENLNGKEKIIKIPKDESKFLIYTKSNIRIQISEAKKYQRMVHLELTTLI